MVNTDKLEVGIGGWVALVVIGGQRVLITALIASEVVCIGSHNAFSVVERGAWSLEKMKSVMIIIGKS